MTEIRTRVRASVLASLLLSCIASGTTAEELPLPEGPTPAPVPVPHFPRRLDAYVFRNWGVVPIDRVARAIGAEPEQIAELGRALGLGEPPTVGDRDFRRSHITVIRRNWHLLPYPQLLELLGFTEGELGYSLREDDFLWIKLGRQKPRCEPIAWSPPDAPTRARHAAIRTVVEESLAGRRLADFEPRFAFVDELASPAVESPVPSPEPAGPEELDLAAGLSTANLRGLGAAGDAEVKRLEATLEQLGAAKPTTPARQLRVELEDGDDPTDESHTIIVGDADVTIRAAAPIGAVRGLQELVRRLELRGAPCLLRGAVERAPRFAVRYLHSYFGMYGDALLDPELDAFPDGYLARLSRLGVNGVWLPGLLRTLTSKGRELGLASPDEEKRQQRLAALSALAARAKRQGVGVWLYLNEPRSLPHELLAERPELRGVRSGHASALCTSVPAVLQWMSDATEEIFRAVPDLAGVFTISGSENLTNCWSHHGGGACARCGPRGAAEVIAESQRALAEGMRRAAPNARLVAWDWGWADAWIPDIVAKLGPGIAVQSVSEWSLPIERGGVRTQVGEYSISAVGPGPRAQRTWRLARERGLGAFAKIQAGCTWELSAVPYLPAVELVATHGSRLVDAGVGGVLLGWTLGGCPSPNLEAIARYAFVESSPDGSARTEPTPRQVVSDIARRLHGDRGEQLAEWWRSFGIAFERHFPFHVTVVYQAPLQAGPANLLWVEPTGYAASMVGLAYDHLDGWRGPYPREVFAALLERLASFEGSSDLERLASELRRRADAEEATQRELALLTDLDVLRATRLHFASVAAQARFVLAREAWITARDGGDVNAADRALEHLEAIATAERDTARALLDITRRDSRIGYEASNQYYYLPVDLLEKAVSCEWIRTEWAPARRHD